jgi:serine protease Do
MLGHAFPAAHRLARRQIAAMVVGTLLQGSVAATQPLQPATFVAVSGSVVRVEADREQGRLSVGSGVTVAPSIVITNCHVIRDAATIRISGGGSLWVATEKFADVVHDLCFLHVPAWSGRPVGLGSRESPYVGEPVAAIGFTGGSGRTLRFGQVRALHSLDGGDVIETDTAFTSGASGGGLFDASGAMVGLLTFRRRGSGGGYFSLPVLWIRDRIPTEGQWTEIRPLPLATPFWARDGDSLPYFMRAPTLFAERRWPELIELTERWSAADPRDAEPWCFRGEAMQKLDRPEAAIDAFTAAVALGPDVPSAWYGLALAYAAVGNAMASKRAESRLADLDRGLAAQLRAAVERLDVSP